MKLNEVIREARRARSVSLRELERRTGIDNGLLSMIETGRVAEPSFRKVVKIARALRIGIGRLVKAE